MSTILLVRIRDNLFPRMGYPVLPFFKNFWEIDGLLLRKGGYSNP